jgi:hypothetical protein
MYAEVSDIVANVLLNGLLEKESLILYEACISLWSYAF